jgi:hypothetical protein
MHLGVVGRLVDLRVSRAADFSALGDRPLG